MCQEFGDISSVEQPFSLLSSINFKGENKDIKTKYKVRKTNEAKLLVQLTNIQK